MVLLGEAICYLAGQFCGEDIVFCALGYEYYVNLSKLPNLADPQFLHL